MSSNQNIRPLLLNTSDTGGSATATKRIHRALQSIGVESRMLVQEKSTSDPTIVGPSTTLRSGWSLVRPHIDMLPLRLYGKGNGFVVNWLPEQMNERIEQINPDVVHLNWMGRGMMSHRSIGEISRPIVWRFPDMNALTGGCYYSYGCERFVDQCGSCPQLDSDSDYDLSHLNWHRKRHHWKDLDITVVAPSTWLAEQAQKSSLFGHRQIEVIPNALDTDLFKPRQQALGRELFDLPKHKHLVLFGAVDPVGDQRKGSDLLKDSLQQLSSDNQNIELVVFGSEEPENPPNFNFPTNYVGYLHDEQSLALLYSAADVMVVPSRYEGFGQTVSESLACGTPVVAFNTTGPSDIITHKQTGYLAKPFDSGQLKSGISWILESDRRRERLSDAAREEAVNRYHQTVIGERYLNLYHDIC